MIRPQLSVIMPARDVGAYIGQALTSLTDQLDDPSGMEVIVVDDASTDDTAGIAAGFTDQLPGLQVIRLPEPLSVSAVRNRGLAEATGRYIVFLDADDWLAPRRLQHLVETIAELGVDFLRTDHVAATGKDHRVVRAPQPQRGVALDPRGSIAAPWQRSMVDYPYSWAGIFDRRLADAGLLTFDERLRTAEDRPWIWRLHLRTASYAVVDAPEAFYRREQSTTLSRTTDARQLDILPAIQQMIEVLEADPDPGPYWPKLARTVIDLLSHHLRRSPHMPPGSRAILREGAAPVLARIPAEVLAEQVARAHPGRVWMLHGLLPAARHGSLPGRALRHPMLGWALERSGALRALDAARGRTP